MTDEQFSALTEAELALALADCLSRPEAADGTFLGLSDSALAAKALRLFAAPRGPRMPDAASGGVPGAISTRPATSVAGAETGPRMCH